MFIYAPSGPHIYQDTPGNFSAFPLVFLVGSVLRIVSADWVLGHAPPDGVLLQLAAYPASMARLWR